MANIHLLSATKRVRERANENGTMVDEKQREKKQKQHYKWRNITFSNKIEKLLQFIFRSGCTYHKYRLSVWERGKKKSSIKICVLEIFNTLHTRSGFQAIAGNPNNWICSGERCRLTRGIGTALWLMRLVKMGLEMKFFKPKNVDKFAAFHYLTTTTVTKWNVSQKSITSFVQFFFLFFFFFSRSVLFVRKCAE